MDRPNIQRFEVIQNVKIVIFTDGILGEIIKITINKYYTVFIVLEPPEVIFKEGIELSERDLKISLKLNSLIKLLICLTLLILFLFSLSYIQHKLPHFHLIWTHL
jgi:hypothetical protein